MLGMRSGSHGVVPAGDTTAPTITSSATVSQAENSALSYALTADEAVVWTITGGADAAKFLISGSNLTMTAKDYEIPTDADGNNTYVVQVTATDSAANATNQTITVTVTDVADTATPPATVILVAGQSNAEADGTGSIPSNIAAIDASRVEIWNGAAWVGYVAGTNSSPGAGSTATKWGPEAPFAVDWLADNATGKLRFIKLAVGATAIAQTTGDDWNTGSTGELLDQMTSIVAAARAAIPETTQIILGLIWCQGEGDAWADQARADAYSANLTSFISSSRTNWGYTKMGMMRIYPQSAALPYANTVRATQKTIAVGDANIYLINTDDLTLSDSYHYNAAGKVILGSRMYAALISGVSNEADPPLITTGSSFSLNENLTTVGTLSANEPGTWAIVGGADQAKFTLNSSTGVLAFATAPDYETPTDANTDNAYIVQVQFTSVYSVASAAQTITVTVADVSEGGGVTYLLDGVSSTATAVYSMRKLRGAYAGSAIRVQRSSDSTQQDVGFDGTGELDTAALATFVGAGNGYVVKRYDQSGNGYHLDTPLDTASNAIVTSGTLNTVNSKPAILTAVNGVISNAVPISSIVSASAYTAIGSARPSAGGQIATGQGYGQCCLLVDSGGYFYPIGFSTDNKATVGHYDTGDKHANIAIGSPYPTTEVIVGTFSGGTISAYRNGGSPVTQAAGNIGDLTGTMRAGGSYAGSPFTGHQMELIIFNALVSKADLNTMGADIAGRAGASWTTIP